MKGNNPQPAIAAIGYSLEIGKDLVDQIAVVAKVSPM